MAMGDRRAASLTPLGPAAEAGNFGRGPALIDEDERLRIKLGLGLEPGLATGDNIRPLLLGGVGGFF